MKLVPTQLTFAAGMAMLLTAPAQAAQVIGGPTGGEFTIGSLPNGNYRFCSDRPPNDIQRVSGVCFRFRKAGNDVVGEYYYPYKGSSLCVNGEVNQNTITGQGVEPLGANPAIPMNLPTTDALSDWEQEGFLQVGRAQLVLHNESPERVRYRSLLMNLNDFYQFNAGTVLPPQRCSNPATDPAYNADYTVVPDYLTVVGESPYYELPVYLDQRGIRQVADGTYRYRTRIGVSDRKAETDLLVNCDQVDRVRLYRTRYYNDANQISEVEELNTWQSVRADSPNASMYNSNQRLCDA